MKIQHVTPELHFSGSVAIVGSSGNLIDSNFGEFIDSHDEVIRFNRSPTKNYSTDVGSKTTLRVVNNHVFNNNDITNEGYSNSPPNFVRDLRENNILYVGPDLGPWHNRNTNCHESNNLFLFDYSSIQSLKNTFKYYEDKNFQVGTISILLCIISGIKPNLFGFDLEPVARTHYYEDRPSVGSAYHNISKEQQLIIALNQQGFLRVCK